MSVDFEKVKQDIEAAYAAVKEQVSHKIIGQQEVLEHIFISLISGGHCLLTGVPGLGKTLMVKTLAQALKLDFNRIQFTPDLMPADIIGTEMLEEDQITGKHHFRFVEGPIFTNVLLADEINRTPPKTQAALLEAMEERQVTAAGNKHVMANPFIVLATQNPIEQEGTYPLPEAQLDRFLFNLVLEFLPEQDEIAMVMQTTDNSSKEVAQVLSAEKILEIQGFVREIPVAEDVAARAVKIVRSSRPDVTEFDDIRRFVRWGAGSRASQALVLAGKARAALHGRLHVSFEDIEALSVPVLRHRMLTNFQAEAEGVKVEDLILQIVKDLQG
ncbi:MAG: AAA family ATPase [Lentisphaeria bacterium]|nr:AAA family ATPase [Lentisphaeria bacterium]